MAKALQSKVIQKAYTDGDIGYHLFEHLLRAALQSAIETRPKVQKRKPVTADFYDSVTGVGDLQVSSNTYAGHEGKPSETASEPPARYRPEILKRACIAALVQKSNVHVPWWGGTRLHKDYFGTVTDLSLQDETQSTINQSTCVTATIARALEQPAIRAAYLSEFCCIDVFEGLLLCALKEEVEKSSKSGFFRSEDAVKFYANINKADDFSSILPSLDNNEHRPCYRARFDTFDQVFFNANFPIDEAAEAEAIAEAARAAVTIQRIVKGRPAQSASTQALAESGVARGPEPDAPTPSRCGSSSDSEVDPGLVSPVLATAFGVKPQRLNDAFAAAAPA